MIVLWDFADNYQFLVQDEIESFHWSKEYWTLHPLIVYFIDDDGNIRHNSFSSLMIITTIQILFIKYKQFLLITLKKTFQLWIRSSIYLMAVLNNIRIAKTSLVCVIISKISIWMLNGNGKSSWDDVGGFVKQYFPKCSLQRPLHDQILSCQSVLGLCVREIPSITFFIRRNL